MIALVIIAASFTYLGVWLTVSRRLYGRWRAKYLDRQDGRGMTLAWDIRQFNEMWRGESMTGAVLTAAVWPLSLPVFGAALLVHRWLDATPPQSRRELAAEQARLKARIAELEHDLGIGGTR